MDDDIKLVLKIMAGIIVAVAVLVALGNVPVAYEQSHVTGYSFWECYWAGDTIKQINLKEVKNGQH